MVTLEERLRKLTEQQNIPEVKAVSNPIQDNTNPKNHKTPQTQQQNSQTNPTTTASIKDKTVARTNELVQGLKKEADGMEHSMVTKLCNTITEYLFGILTYPLELLDTWIVCINLLPKFKEMAMKIYIIMVVLGLSLAIWDLILTKDITLTIAITLFGVVGYGMLGVK